MPARLETIETLLWPEGTTGPGRATGRNRCAPARSLEATAGAVITTEHTGGLVITAVRVSRRCRLCGHRPRGYRCRRDAPIVAHRRTHPLSRTHPLRPLRIDAAASSAAAFLQFGDLPLDPVEMQIDLPLVVATETDPEDNIVNLLGGNRLADRLPGKRGLDPVQEFVNFFDLVAPAERLAPETLTLTSHYVS